TLQRQLELLLQPLRRRLHPRVHLHGQRLLVAVSADGQPHQVLSRQHQRPPRLGRRVAVDRRDRVLAPPPHPLPPPLTPGAPPPRLTAPGAGESSRWGRPVRSRQPAPASRRSHNAAPTDPCYRGSPMSPGRMPPPSGNN